MCITRPETVLRVLAFAASAIASAINLIHTHHFWPSDTNNYNTIRQIWEIFSKQNLKFLQNMYTYYNMYL
jgi:hypothetical protein